MTLTLEALAALALGLLASAAVTDAAQATLALPMLCFPQVLFAGAIVPVPDMAAPGPGDQPRTGQPVGVRVTRAGSRARPAGRLPVTVVVLPGRVHREPGRGWAVLAGFVGLLLVATVAVLQRRAPA